MKTYLHGEMWHKLDELREYILSLNLNVEDTFKKVGDFVFYSNSDGYVSISRDVKENGITTSKTILDLHPGGGFGRTVSTLDKFVGTREEALRLVNEEWDKLDSIDSVIAEIKTVLKSEEKEAKRRAAIVKDAEILKLKKKLEQLESDK